MELRKIFSLKKKEEKKKAECIDEEEFNNSIIKTFAVASGLLPFRGGPALFLDTTDKTLLERIIPGDVESEKDRGAVKSPPSPLGREKGGGDPKGRRFDALGNELYLWRRKRTL